MCCLCCNVLRLSCSFGGKVIHFFNPIWDAPFPQVCHAIVCPSLCFCGENIFNCRLNISSMKPSCISHCHGHVCACLGHPFINKGLLASYVILVFSVPVSHPPLVTGGGQETKQIPWESFHEICYVTLAKSLSFRKEESLGLPTVIFRPWQ